VKNFEQLYKDNLGGIGIILGKKRIKNAFFAKSKPLIVVLVYLLLGFSVFNSFTHAASPSVKVEVYSSDYPLFASNNKLKKNLFQAKKGQQTALPRPKNNSRIIPATRHWHWMTGLAVLFSIAFVASLYALIGSVPTVLYWVAVLTTPFLAYLFAWLAYKKCENAPEKFKGNQFNWFIIAIVTGIIYLLMALTTVLVPILFVLGIFYGGGTYVPDLFGLRSMWENPPKIPPFPKKNRNESKEN